MSTLLIVRLLRRVTIKGKIAENEKEPGKSKDTTKFLTIKNIFQLYMQI